MEQLYYNIGLANLLGGHFPEAEDAFTKCATKYPNDLLTSRCALGVGKACIGQVPPKIELAARMLLVAMKDPKLNIEARISLAQVFNAMGNRRGALGLFKALMGADIRSPSQTAAAVEVIDLLAADAGNLDELVNWLAHLTKQAGVRDAIGWYTNQVIVRGDPLPDRH